MLHSSAVTTRVESLRTAGKGRCVRQPRVVEVVGEVEVEVVGDVREREEATWGPVVVVGVVGVIVDVVPLEGVVPFPSFKTTSGSTIPAASSMNGVKSWSGKFKRNLSTLGSTKRSMSKQR